MIFYVQSPPCCCSSSPSPSPYSSPSPYCSSATPGTTLQKQNAKNLKKIFSEKEYWGLSPNFHIHFCWRKYVDQSWEYIHRSQTHECGNWDWGLAIPRKGIYKRNCRCSAGARPGTARQDLKQKQYKFRTRSALMPVWTPPMNKSAELTQWAF